MYIIVIEIKEVVNYDILKNFKNKNQIILDNVIIVIYNVIKQNKSFKKITSAPLVQKLKRRYY